MKISTAHVYRLGVHSITSQQEALAKTQAQLSSGKRINLPSDDPTGMAKLLDIKAGIDRIDQFSRNTEFANSALALEESVLSQVNNSLQRVRELILQANNATNTVTDRESIAQEVVQRMQELTSLANSRDAAGNYLFAGNRTNVVPFTVVNGSITYNGDQGERSLQTGANTQVRLSDSGDSAFLRIRNGDGTLSVQADPANAGEAVFGSFNSNAVLTDSYRIEFIAGATPGDLEFEVRDSSSTLIASGPYTLDDSISFAGISVNFTGLPEVGDGFDVLPAQNQSVFATIENVLAALDDPSGVPATNAHVHNELARGIADIDQALAHFNNIRASVGSRLNALETTDTSNQDLKLHLETIKSETGDLDFVEAISRFNQQLTSLEAAQQAFARATELSLFRFL